MNLAYSGVATFASGLYAIVRRYELNSPSIGWVAFYRKKVYNLFKFTYQRIPCHDLPNTVR